MRADKKIKIVHLVSDLGIGGVQKVVLDICSSADKNKYDIFIYCLNHDTTLANSYNLRGITIECGCYQYDTDYSLSGYFKHLFRSSYIRQKATDIIKAVSALKPDILHVHIHPRELNLGILIQRATGCKLLLTIHSTHFSPPAFSLSVLAFMFRFVLHKYNLIAVSENIYNELKKHRLQGKGKILALIENKVNLSLFRIREKENEELMNVVYVARIALTKGHKELIEAWSKVKSVPAKKRLLLAGPDDTASNIRELAVKLQVADTVVFLGPQHDIPALLANCHIGVFPSHKEGLPLALLEKMAAGVPVIVSNIPELTSIVTHGYNGLVFKLGDSKDLADQLKELLKNSALRKKLGNNARKTVEGKYGSNNIALPNEKIYEKLMDCT